MQRFLFGLFAVLFLSLALKSSADTDYVCLKACVGDGDAYTSCLPKCTYDTMQSPAVYKPQADYACLKGCVDGGIASTVCMPRCTSLSGQSVLLPSNTDTSTGIQTHNVFKAPTPYEGLILSPKPTQTAPLSTDYRCLKLCTASGLQYQLCNQRCAK